MNGAPFAFHEKPNNKTGEGPFRNLPLFRTPARARTADKLIKSQLLYQLSYGGMMCFSHSRGLTDWYPRAGSNRGQID